MKITDKGPADIGVSELVRNKSTASTDQGEEGREGQRSGEPARVTISPEARQLQKVAELARRGDELRAEKVDKLKAQISRGEYHVDSEEVAKSMVRSEISRLLSKK